MEQNTVTKVTVAGITGAIGPILIDALHEAGFEVQAFTRQVNNSGPRQFLPCIRVVDVDYTDEVGLRKILAGQDAVVSTLGDTAGAVAAQRALIEASAAAGVKRFIPSEFGSDTMNERVRSFPFFADKLKHQELLKAAAARMPGFTYSILITGPFLDWGLSVVPFIINLGNWSAQIFDGGNVPFSTTRVVTLAKAVVATLQNFNDTANRTLYVHDALITQNQLISRAQHLNGKLAFNTTAMDSRTLENEAWELLRTPSADALQWLFSFINISIWSIDELCAFRSPDNKLLGIPELKGTELNEVLDEEITKAMKALSGIDDVAMAANTALVNSRAADAAFESGKQKLVGFKTSV